MDGKGLTSITLGLTAAFLSGGLLVLWRLLYPVSDAALLLPGVVALVIWRGTARRALARHHVWRAAVLRRESWLFRLLTGRLTAHLSGIVAGLLAVTALAEFALTASPASGLAALGVIAVTGVVLPLVARLFAGHLTARLLAPALVPPLAWGLGLAATGYLFWRGWYVEPIPPEADAASLAAALEMAQAALPARDHLAAWLLALPRSLETAGWVLAGQGADFAFAPIGFILVLSYHALIGGALVRFTLDCACALLPGGADEG